MSDWLSAIGYTAIIVADFAVLWGLLLWRGNGQPVPSWLEWSRDHWATRWIYMLRARPVLVGF